MTACGLIFLVLSHFTCHVWRTSIAILDDNHWLDSCCAQILRCCLLMKHLWTRELYSQYSLMPIKSFSRIMKKKMNFNIHTLPANWADDVIMCVIVVLFCGWLTTKAGVDWTTWTRLELFVSVLRNEKKKMRDFVVKFGLWL